MNFSAPYNREEYVAFFRNQFLPDDFEAGDEQVPLSFSAQYTQQITKIGRSSSLDLNVYEVQHRSENDPRVSLSRESFRLLAEYGQKRALVLFISKPSPNYRLSLVTLDLKWEEGRKPTREYSNPKRFSFFLGPDAKIHTPHEYLVSPGRVEDLEDLKKRFSIEVVNKEFYTKIAILFTKLTGGTRKIGSQKLDEKGSLVFPSPDDTKKKEFAVRLIGRLVFCWFLKKKRSKQDVALLPEELLSIEALNKNKGYYHNVLEPLFFEVLNTPMDARDKRFTQKPWATIPFLNGGLFTPHEDDYYTPDDFQGISPRGDLKVPDDWLLELLKVFETYNFTIDENTPVDVELAIEPEMLGRIFENLLAEINPETGETARKSTGSYYTPRPIVEYMVDESLKQYLLTKTGLSEQKIRALLSYNNEDTDLTDSQKDSVIDALGCIRIIDPACGSGAFPMGILQKILLVLQKLDPDSKKWLDKLLSSVPDPMYQKELKSKIDQPNYLHKLGIIKDCIFGIDIQPIAVEISKLRCFLSLIVDESVDDKKSNRGVEPLPNLEFKFVCANTLVGLPKAEVAQGEKSRSKYGPKEYKGQSLMLEAADEIKELKKLRDEYLRSYGKEKKNIEGRFAEIQSKLRKHTLQWSKTDTQTAKLADWEPFSHKSCPWFDPEWMFGIKDGFDIVIANPPYNARLSDEERNHFKRLYDCVKSGRVDTAALFVELARRIGSGQMQFAYILPYRLFSRKRNHGQFQVYTLRKFSIRRIIYLGSDVGFSSNDEFMILTMTSTHMQNNQVQIAVKPSMDELHSQSIYSQVDQFQLIQRGEVNINMARFDQRLLSKIENDTLPLNAICQVKDGIVPFIRDKLLSERKVDARYVRFAGIAGKYILQRYYFSCDELYLCYDINEAKKYIKDRTELRKVQLRDRDIFLRRKILTAQNSNVLKGAIDEKQIFVSNSLHSTYLREEYKDQFMLEYILALINSKLLNYYHDSLRLKATDLHPQVLIADLQKLPIKKLGLEKQKPVVFIVERILNITKAATYRSNPQAQADVAEHEKQIDQMVYKLYGLTDEEIAIVEGRNQTD